MHRPGRIGAHIFDIDRPFRARRAGAEALAVDENRLQDLLVNLWLQHDIDEAGAGGFGALHIRLKLEIGDKRFRKRARVRAGLLGFPRIDHRRVGREVAVGRLARRLDDEAAKIEVARQFARRDPLFERLAMRDWKSAKMFMDPDQRGRANACASHFSVMAGLVARLYRKSGAPSKSRACSAIANRSVMPAI